MDAPNPLEQTCPTCKATMEEGHVMGIPTPQGVNFAASTIGWLNSFVQLKGRGLSDQDRAVPLVEVDSFPWSRSARFPAWRCTKCRLVLFSYSDAERALHPNPPR